MSKGMRQGTIGQRFFSDVIHKMPPRVTVKSTVLDFFKSQPDKAFTAVDVYEGAASAMTKGKRWTSLIAVRSAISFLKSSGAIVVTREFQKGRLGYRNRCWKAA